MTVYIVILFEVINIEHAQANRDMEQSRTLEVPFQALLKVIMIKKSG